MAPGASARAKQAQAEPLPLFAQRASGVLLHPTSLPGPWGCGDLGPAAHGFARYLASARQRVWQMLPVGPVGYGNSPYSAASVCAGEPRLISIDSLFAEGLLAALPPRLPSGARADYAAAGQVREQALRSAFDRFHHVTGFAPLRKTLARFVERNQHWLEDYALYQSIKSAQGGRPWVAWPLPLRLRRKLALRKARAEHAHEVEFHRFVQFIFDRQWQALRDTCASLGISLVGDLPLFPAHDSAEVWVRPGWYSLDAGGQLTAVAGVPPDYFSRLGQRWGNPLYRWSRLRRDGYGHWLERFSVLLRRFDAVRLDHFIGYVRYWEIPAAAQDARRGRFRAGPGEELFTALRKRFGALPLIAEDLGLVTPEVTALREKLGLPGITILQFAFGTDPQSDSFKPHNYVANSVAYTGTHDNDTAAGWYSERKGGTRSAAQTERERRAARDYLGCARVTSERATPQPTAHSPQPDPAPQIHWEMIRALQASVARLAITPMQDLLGLGSEARMNLPGTSGGNWEWRLRPGEASREVASRLARLTARYGRAP